MKFLWNLQTKVLNASVGMLRRSKRFCSASFYPSAKWSKTMTVGSALTFGAIAYCSLFIRQRIAFNDAKEDLSAWKNRWVTGNIAFHLNEIHPALVKFLGPLLEDSISPPEFPKRILVPLCGKTMDIIFLQNLGHKVRVIIMCFLFVVSPSPHFQIVC